MKKVLLIEDEKNLSRFIELELKYEGYEIGLAFTGRDGLDMALNEEWDVILLDLMLPGLNGLEVCRRIRQSKETPILMITARDSVMDRVSGLDSGADDYIVKPFAIEELLARLRAVFRRTQNDVPQSPVTSYVHNNLTVYKESRQVFKEGSEIEVTKREYDLLLAFLENKNIVLTREVLLNKVWGYDTEVETNVVDVYVRYLRNKLDSPEEESIIQTVRGTGYVMRS
ncbi:PhoB family transcriptional regulator [[Bacillus] enclensis]|uniref:DNA-binding response regulator, OmpR family, contains REC and winged-helix (WHTH) domain n=2 Tax=Rossellomorea TaxID=2837508 RepID=A0A0V8HL45_9BACI|nr:response regulator transcription factor [[Bacillus] enclensis]OAT83828.1 DNA-binding response regulator [Bacillus sp. MKU004]QTC43118.1 response regulator transcription factor [Bacillus sp. V3]KSU63269.1 PhoB family transcriptional regulator [[Bacillus] enclensis]MBH9964712.1 response regulator transcription factor [[Bacillus] enclensis]SCB81064.1 DNA-binding response regulator, OmpR family, contains REC and winged-helix (wHTH) domain [[Bacillus] enclensis]